MASPLPHPHAFITSMISQLVTIPSTSQDSSPITLSSLNGRDHKSVKSIFTTLHFLFPHELLPALDLLDRKLVTQFVVTAPQASSSPTAKSASSSKKSTAANSTSWEIFYVLSASATPSTSSKSTSKYRRVYNQSGTYYEVNLETWNCTCPAFAYSAFGRTLDLSDEQTSRPGEDDVTEAEIGDDYRGWQFGGTLTKEGSDAPICKHILAAVLGKALPDVFGGGVERKEVTPVEAAGWGGGWGD